MALVDAGGVEVSAEAPHPALFGVQFLRYRPEFQFKADRLGNSHPPLQLSQAFSLSEQNKIMKRAGVGDDNHRPCSSFFLAFFKYLLVLASLSKSSTV